MFGRIVANAGRRALMAQGSAQRFRMTTRRNFGGHGHGHEKGEAKYGYFVPPHVDPFYKRAGEYMSIVMWLWVFYRCKEDGATVFFGIHPFDSHGDDDHHGHDDHHGDHDHEYHHNLHWEKEVGSTPTLAEH